jgi:hypothetical protein
MVTGRRVLRNSGSDSEPKTLSTAIFSGNGVSRVSGVESKLNKKMPAI